jgi:mitogen-activated protein kinase 1/3
MSDAEAAEQSSPPASTRSKRGADGSDKRQTHKFTVATSTFEIDSKYTPIKQIGSGAYGVVIAATDIESGEKVAIKKIHRAFEDLIDAKRILREIKLLRHFDHDNVISILDILPPPSVQEFEDVYIVTDLMETDLHRVIYSRQALTDDHIQYFLYQILCALKYIHSADVLHRDLKPSNILLNSNCDLKICDFGLARGVMPEDDESEQAGANLTEYVVTRWYRAPEIMLSCQDYKKGIDLWSVGCIFAEMLGRKPLFPGNDYIHQLKIIAEIVGKPLESDMDFIGNEKAKRFMLSLEDKGAKDLAEMYPQANSQAIDLLNQVGPCFGRHAVTCCYDRHAVTCCALTQPCSVCASPLVCQLTC